MSKYTNTKIESIWSPEETKRLMYSMWEEHTLQMQKAGFKDARKFGKYNKPALSSNHEVVDALRDFVAETGLLNAHAGLTSSDIIDNVRLAQVKKSIDVVHSSIKSVIVEIDAIEGMFDKPCVGYTHWQVASHTRMGGRFATWANLLEYMSGLHDGSVRAKTAGGAVGIGSATKILTGTEYLTPWAHLGTEQPVEGVYMQSTTHVEELMAAQWLELIMAQVHKIAQDIRFLCHTGELSILHDAGYRGSSAMPGKSNPIEAEQICSLARRQPNYTRQIWDAMAFNGLERTLDNSALLRTTLPEMFNNAVYCLQKLAVVIDRLRVDEKKCAEILEENKEIAYAEDKMAERIKNGEPRTQIYEEMSINKYGR